MNILWITTDHQQWRTINGRSLCRTPNIQRLVDEGIVFGRSYTPMPVCCPVRAMWMSGAYPWHNGVHTQVHSAPSLTRDMVPEVVTYSQRLHEAGYRQGFVGKWHASYRRTPLDFGFDEPGLQIFLFCILRYESTPSLQGFFSTPVAAGYVSSEPDKRFEERYDLLSSPFPSLLTAGHGHQENTEDTKQDKESLAGNCFAHRFKTPV